jgi:hypothetical protein
MKRKTVWICGMLSILYSWDANAQQTSTQNAGQNKERTFLSQPLIPNMFTADPSARFFNNKIYVYPSHDIETGVAQTPDGDHFNMKDYHVFSMDSVTGKITDHGIALDLKDVPWASKQLWAPDAISKDGKYYLFFPAKDKNNIFRVGVAIAEKPEGPFKAEPNFIEGTYSIDPCVFMDTDGSTYLYFGGIWGGQLQRWKNGKYDSTLAYPKADDVALNPRMAKLTDDLKKLAEPVKDIQILDENGQILYEKNDDKRFFEGAWVHKYNNKYYLSYSTGNTHYVSYAIADNPYGPFIYKGVILNPVAGWTTHHSILEVRGKWYIFYHDTQLSGKTYLRNIKVAELTYNADGSIKPITTVK